mgnify:CR=1 FL=1
MNVFLMFLAAMAVFWLGVELVQPHSAFLSFVVYGLALWLLFETALEAARTLFDIVGSRH